MLFGQDSPDPLVPTSSPTPSPEPTENPVSAPSESSAEPAEPSAAAPSPEEPSTAPVDELPTSEAGSLQTLESPQDGAPLTTEDIIPMEAPTTPPLPDSLFTDPNAIIPEDLPPVPPPSVAVESETRRQRDESIRLREVRVKAEKDPQVAELFAKSEAATATEDKRAALREYYRLLFKKIASMDESLKDRCALMEDAYIRRLAQTRLEPTIPLHPPPTPEPLP